MVNVITRVNETSVSVMLIVVSPNSVVVVNELRENVLMSVTVVAVMVISDTNVVVVVVSVGTVTLVPRKDVKVETEVVVVAVILNTVLV